MGIESYFVTPALPERLEALRELAYNFLWTWSDDIRALFRRLDRELWERVEQNPVLLLGSISQERLDEAAKDDGFLAFLDRVHAQYRSYMEGKAWWDRHHPTRPLVAYFSAEYGVAECLPIYSGGLGVLAAHHLKSASDLGVPLVGVGLLYQQGYFRQYLTSDGWQQERYPVNDFFNLPVQPASSASGTPLQVELHLAGRAALAQVWRAQVGRVDLYLLDTNLPENPPDLQQVTSQLYGGDQEMRIRQEIVLGVGGLRALVALGLEPVVCHMNEGHSAFLALERIRTLVRESGLRFTEALEVVRAGAVFTSHTPVPAGFDVFPAALMEKYFSDYAREVGAPLGEILALGRANGSTADGFNMAGLALRTAAFANAVSRLHGEVSRTILRPFMPALPEPELPIGHVTNGAHTPSCVSREMAGLFDRYLGPEWWQRPGDPESWEGVDSIPDEELWATHERRRERLVAFARRRLARQLTDRGAAAHEIEQARGVLDTRALTIGFARRFASYKRANLILSDVERLERLLRNASRPVQIVFAGKAHPQDTEGKEILRQVVSFCQSNGMRRHAVFLEDYDLLVSRQLVQGVDVWLNTPRRGLEASGTSGMKALPNGVLNLSILDGWWCEGYTPETGWAIGQGEDYTDHDYQDSVESSALFDLLEHDVAPLFYDRGSDGLPRRWIAMMKRSLKSLSPRFSTNRMLFEYSERYYLPASRAIVRLREDGFARARSLADFKHRLGRAFGEVRIESLDVKRNGRLQVGDSLPIEARIHLGQLEPGDVAVEAYFGPLDAQRSITAPRALPLQPRCGSGQTTHLYVGEVPCERSGRHGLTLRVRPVHPDDPNILATGLMVWRGPT
jgi:starch phosphorylase